LGQLDSMADG